MREDRFQADAHSITNLVAKGGSYFGHRVHEAKVDNLASRIRINVRGMYQAGGDVAEWLKGRLLNRYGSKAHHRFESCHLRQKSVTSDK